MRVNVTNIALLNPKGCATRHGQILNGTITWLQQALLVLYGWSVVD
jgi:hypothetical protein